LRRAGLAVARALLLAVVLTMAGAPAIAQDNYPSRPVKIIAPQAPGGGVDLVARIIADRLRVALGQSFVV
jgi:tripartite-type tricarboxylate transporter receptor subunit TctC